MSSVYILLLNDYIQKSPKGTKHRSQFLAILFAYLSRTKNLEENVV
nr:MAG TPA: hypothetical protein [Bacteriophage sp.]DAZ75729.1 MAG TPA: hypothetical protein [Caudoviricetes sp.]